MPQFYNDPPAQSNGSAASAASDSGNQQQYSDENPPNFSEDKAGWVRYYYGEEYLEDGKYPRGITIDHGEGSGGVKITGYKTTPETHPWLYPGPGDVHTNGKVYPSSGGMYDSSTGKYQHSIKASPADIKASHDKRNYYKNGGNGLPPEMMRTFVDDRSPNSPYWQRHETNRRAISAGVPLHRLPYKDLYEVTGPYGRYNYQRPNSVPNPNYKGGVGGYDENGVLMSAYMPAGMTPSRFTSNGTVWDPENPLPRGSAPRGGEDSSQPPAPPPSHREPPPEQTPAPPPQDAAPPPFEEPPSNTGPVQPRPGPTTSVVGSTTQSMTPGAGQATPDPMAMAQGSGGGLLSQAAPLAQPAPQQGALGQARQPGLPSSGMFGT